MTTTCIIVGSSLILLNFSLWGGCFAKQPPLSLTSLSLLHITKNLTWHCMRRAMKPLTCSNVLALSLGIRSDQTESIGSSVFSKFWLARNRTFKKFRDRAIRFRVFVQSRFLTERTEHHTNSNLKNHKIDEQQNKNHKKIHPCKPNWVWSWFICVGSSVLGWAWIF